MKNSLLFISTETASQQFSSIIKLNFPLIRSAEVESLQPIRKGKGKVKLKAHGTLFGDIWSPFEQFNFAAATDSDESIPIPAEASPSRARSSAISPSFLRPRAERVADYKTLSASPFYCYYYLSFFAGAVRDRMEISTIVFIVIAWQ